LNSEPRGVPNDPIPIHLGGLVPDAISGFGKFCKRDGWLHAGAKQSFGGVI
jgi:hypothetical protein